MSASDGSNPAGNDSLVVLDGHDAAELGRLLRKLSGLVGEKSKQHFKPASEAQREQYKRSLHERARQVLTLRKLRGKYFSPVLFREPAWDILLELYVALPERSSLCISDLSTEIRVPMTTALRWLDYLEGSKLVSRQHSPTDKRKSMIALTEEGRARLDQYFEQVALAMEER